MDRRSLLIAAAVSGTALTLTGRASAQSSAGDAAAVRALLDAYAASWAAGDAKAMFDLAVADVHWVNIVGMHWQGKAQAELAHKVYLETMFRGVPLTLEAVESITAVGPDVLVVVARWNVGAFVPPSGGKVPAAKDRMSLILRRTPEGLRIAHGANVQIDPVAARFDPANGPPDRTSPADQSRP